MLEGVEKLAVDRAGWERGEGFVEAFQVMLEGAGRVGIEDETLAAGSDAFDFEAGGDGREHAVFDFDLQLGFGGRDLRATAEGLAGAGRPIDGEADPFGFGRSVGEQLDTAEAGGSEGGELAGDVFFINGGAQPPPARLGFGFASYLRLG